MSNNDNNKTIEEINEEIERQFENNEFDKTIKKKPEFLSLKFLFTLVILGIVIYRIIQSMI